MGTDDRALRPTGFDQFLGQEESKAVLRTMVQAARERGDAADHVLFAGGPGLGKTTLANIMAREMGVRLLTVNCPSIRTKAELSGLLVSLRRGDILFLDEIHSLNPRVAEVLYPVMEDFKLEIVTGQGATTSAMRLPLEPFTLIGATTREGMLPQPLRDRFGVSVLMTPYSTSELATIASSAARKLGYRLEGDAAVEVASRSRGTPRLALRLVRRVRDAAQLRSERVVTDPGVVDSVCRVLGVDSAGLDRSARAYLALLRDRNSPAGLSVICSSLSEEKDTVEEVIEPTLLQLGFVERTPKGRTITAAGRKHLEECR